MAYASDTSVPVAKSMVELDQLITKYGGADFGYQSIGLTRYVGWRMQNRTVRMSVIMPAPDSLTTRQYEQEERRRWRVLVLSVKAKLVMVAEGVATFEQEFLSYMVTSRGTTVAEEVLPRIDQVLSEGQLALPSGPAPAR